MNRGLIQEIQYAALKQSTSIDELLRMVKFAAAKLDLGELESWVEQELNGYITSVPEYRKIHGRPYAWNPYNGWIPILFEDAEMMDAISQVPVGQSIGSLDEMLKRSDDGEFHFPLPSDVIVALNDLMNFQTPRAVLKIARSSLVSMIGVVQSKILDWAIAMEKKGVSGEGMSFDNQERRQAQQAMMTFNIGDIGNFTGNLGSQSQAETNVSGDVNTEQIFEASRRIKDAVPQMGLSDEQTELLQQTLAALEDEARKGEPNTSRLKSFTSDARAILTGAGGNLTAQGALAILASLF